VSADWWWNTSFIISWIRLAPTLKVFDFFVVWFTVSHQHNDQFFHAWEASKDSIWRQHSWSPHLHRPDPLPNAKPGHGLAVGKRRMRRASAGYCPALPSSIRPSWRGLRRTYAALATSRVETSARIALAKSVRRVGQAAEGAKCPQKNSQNFILRFWTGFGPRWPPARTWRKPSPPAGFRGCHSISPKRPWHRQRLF